jgi:hypothetical protein
MSGIQPARNSRLWPLIAEAESAATNPERLRELSQHPSLWVRRPVHVNPATPDDAILGMIGDPRNAKTLGWSEALRGRLRLEGPLSVWPDAEIRADLAFTYGWVSGSLSRRTQAVLAGDPSEHVRINMARTTSYADLFLLLLGDSSPAVRGACADNPRIDKQQMERLITDSVKTVRCRAVSMGMRFPDEEQLLRLASDRSSSVRWAVLFNPRSPREAIELIAQDKDEDNRQHAQAHLDGQPGFS